MPTNPGAPTYADPSAKRRELRFPCRPTAVDIIEAGTRTPALAIEVSRNGCRFQFKSPLPLGAHVVVDFAKYQLAGTVRYCREDGEGAFEVGMETEDFRPQQPA